MPGEWLNLSEVAAELGIHPSTARNWADQGRLPVHRTQGGHRRFKRSEIDLWWQSQQVSVSDDADTLIRNALRKTRVQISEGHLEAERWYQKLDREARDKYRQSGRHLMQGLLVYLASDGEEATSEARSLGYEYATRGRRYDLKILDATQAFLFFRNTLFDALIAVYEAAGIRSPLMISTMFRKVLAFTDQILVTILETYEAFEKNSN